MTQRWYWCLRHGRVEPPRACPGDLRLGPYDTPEEATRYAERAEARNRRWEEDDRVWHGEDGAR